MRRFEKFTKDRTDKCDTRYWEKDEEKRLYYIRNDIDILSPSLYTFYELLYSDFTAINSDGEVIITKFFKHEREFDGLSEYYDSEYTETESECSCSEDETESESIVIICLSVCRVRGIL